MGRTLSEWKGEALDLTVNLTRRLVRAMPLTTAVYLLGLTTSWAGWVTTLARLLRSVVPERVSFLPQDGAW